MYHIHRFVCDCNLAEPISCDPDIPPLHLTCFVHPDVLLPRLSRCLAFLQDCSIVNNSPSDLLVTITNDHELPSLVRKWVNCVIFLGAPPFARLV